MDTIEKIFSKICLWLSATSENKAIVKIRSTRSDRSDRDGSLSKKLISVGLLSTRNGQTYTKYVWGRKRQNPIKTKKFKTCMDFKTESQTNKQFYGWRYFSELYVPWQGYLKWLPICSHCSTPSWYNIATVVRYGWCWLENISCICNEEECNGEICCVHTPYCLTHFVWTWIVVTRDPGQDILPTPHDK